jgi:RimJ/RimL family protein N-acetyltransferase
MEKARKKNLVYADQAFIPGKKGEYPEKLETYRTTSSGLEIFIRPVKMSDESALQDFFHDLSDNSLYRRFLSLRHDMPHPRVQEFTVVDYTRDLILLAFLPEDADGIPVAMGQFNLMGETHLAEVAFAVLDDHQRMGIASEMLSTLTFIAKKRGLLGFTASVLVQNRSMLRVFEKAGFRIEPGPEEEVHELKLLFM